MSGRWYRKRLEEREVPWNNDTRADRARQYGLCRQSRQSVGFKDRSRCHVFEILSLTCNA